MPLKPMTATPKSSAPPQHGTSSSTSASTSTHFSNNSRTTTTASSSSSSSSLNMPGPHNILPSAPPKSMRPPSALPGQPVKSDIQMRFEEICFKSPLPRRITQIYNTLHPNPPPGLGPRAVLGATPIPNPGSTSSSPLSRLQPNSTRVGWLKPAGLEMQPTTSISANTSRTQGQVQVLNQPQAPVRTIGTGAAGVRGATAVAQSLYPVGTWGVAGGEMKLGPAQPQSQQVSPNIHGTGQGKMEVTEDATVRTTVTLDAVDTRGKKRASSPLPPPPPPPPAVDSLVKATNNAITVNTQTTQKQIQQRKQAFKEKQRENRNSEANDMGEEPREKEKKDGSSTIAYSGWSSTKKRRLSKHSGSGGRIPDTQKIITTAQPIIEMEKQQESLQVTDSGDGSGWKDIDGDIQMDPGETPAPEPDPTPPPSSAPKRRTRHSLSASLPSNNNQPKPKDVLEPHTPAPAKSTRPVRKSPPLPSWVKTIRPGGRLKNKGKRDKEDGMPKRTTMTRSATGIETAEAPILSSSVRRKHTGIGQVVSNDAVDEEQVQHSPTVKEGKKLKGKGKGNGKNKEQKPTPTSTPISKPESPGGKHRRSTRRVTFTPREWWVVGATPTPIEKEEEPSTARLKETDNARTQKGKGVQKARVGAEDDQDESKDDLGGQGTKHTKHTSKTKSQTGEARRKSSPFTTPLTKAHTKGGSASTRPSSTGVGLGRERRVSMPTPTPVRSTRTKTNIPSSFSMKESSGARRTRASLTVGGSGGGVAGAHHEVTHDEYEFSD